MKADMLQKTGKCFCTNTVITYKTNETDLLTLLHIIKASVGVQGPVLGHAHTEQYKTTTGSPEQ